jgi:serine/threonine protein kinase
MKKIKDFFGSLFVPAQKPHMDAKPTPPAGMDAPRKNNRELCKSGDVIGGKYTIQNTLGKGGFAVVYLACRDGDKLCALKTFRDELLADASAGEAFKKEAMLWVNLEEHPFILAAR